jgi:hypothetical protein
LLAKRRKERRAQDMNLYHKVCILTLSRYPDLFDGLLGNLGEFAPGYDRVLVKDGYLLEERQEGWLTVEGPPGPFCYAQNVNLGLEAIDQDADVLLMGDDVRFKDENTIEKLYALAYSQANVGILSPRIVGGADNILLRDPPKDRDIVISERYIPLVCAYIKRKALSGAGKLDAVAFSKGWGWDDVDFSRRVRNAGFTLGVTPRVEVIHGVSRTGSESIIRNEKGDNLAMQNLDNINAQEFLKKWGDNIK